MRYRAIAMASERSNAVGTVELECTPSGLSLVYLGVGAWSQGYAPTEPTERRTLPVPWSGVTRASLEGEQLYLEIDKELGPLNRLCLVHFSSGAALHHHQLYRRRLVVRIATIGAALVGALIASATALKLAPGTSARAALAMACLTALVLAAVGLFADRLLAAGGIEGFEARQAFVSELAGFLPNFAHSPVALPSGPSLSARGFTWFQGFLPRTTAAVVMLLSALTLGLVLMTRWLLTSDPAHELGAHAPSGRNETLASDTLRAPALQVQEPELPAPSARPERSARAAIPAPAASGAAGGPSVGEACRCKRADSLLWATPFPRLSVLLLSQKTRVGREDDERKDKKYLELAVAVVNNSNEPMKDVALLVEFYERDPPPSTKQYLITTRPLYFAGPLEGGQAIKWDVEARGTAFLIRNPQTGDIGGEGESSAPTNLLAELLHAHNRPVRMHGAMLLTFFGDPRAKDAILELREALREDEAPYLDRLMQALGDTRACALHVAEHGSSRSVRACVHNAGKETRKNLGLRVRALDQPSLNDSPTGAPPNVLAEATFAVPGELAADQGVTVSGDFDLNGTNPVAFEAFADRMDLLPR
ncbi:MAG TPA: hypothetical protein VGM29_17855 [Polyangiaceae bacterium]